MLSRIAIASRESKRTDTRAPMLVIVAGKRVYGGKIDEEFLTPDGHWMATEVDGKPCFRVTKTSKPAFYDTTGKDPWYQGVIAGLGLFGFVHTSAKELLEKGEITQEQFDNTAKHNQTAMQLWRKEGEQNQWMPKSKKVDRMVTFVNKRGQSTTYEKKLPTSVPRGPQPRSPSSSPSKKPSKSKSGPVRRPKRGKAARAKPYDNKTETALARTLAGAKKRSTRARRR